MKNNIYNIYEQNKLSMLNLSSKNSKIILMLFKLTIIFMIIALVSFISLLLYYQLSFFFNIYDRIGEKIYISTGTLSFNKLDEYIYKTKTNLTKYNHIHIAMSFNNDYALLTTVTIASLLKNAKEDTYIHLHIIAVDGFIYPTMKKLNSLKSKINNNTEFIFHNGDIVLKDFGNHTRNESKGVGEYARLLAPYFVKDKDRIIVTDSADLFIEKDLVELYNYPLEDKIIKGAIDPYTGCFPDYIHFHKENYFNSGVVLFNSKKWRELNLYQDIVNFYNGFHYKDRLPTPIQDILNTFFPAASLGLLPLRYNFQGYVYLNSRDVYPYSILYTRDCSMFYHRKEMLINDEKNLGIRHCNKYKPYTGEANIEIMQEWRYYAKMTGFYDELCEKYPRACR